MRDDTVARTEGWARFRDLEPNAVALADPTPPPAANAWEPAATSYGAPPPPTFAASSRSTRWALFSVVSGPA